MGIPVMIYGGSGSGKSSSLRNFAEDEIGLINVSSKPLPFKKKFISTLKCDDYTKIRNAISKTDKKSIVIDDATYLIVNHFMKGHSKAGSGNAVFSFYNEIGDNFWNLIEFTKSLPENVIIYFLMHQEKMENGDIKPKTIGKILDDKVCLEGMFTISLRSTISNNKHVFVTQSNGLDVSKSPFMMFEEKEIDNDLKFVDTEIRKFWEL